MKPKFRELLLALIVAPLLALIGCATPGDLETLQRDTTNMTKELLALQRNLYDLNAEIKNLSTKVDTLGKRSDDKVDTLGKRIDDLRQQMSALSAETRAKFGHLEKEIESTSQPIRRYQADLGAQLDKLQNDVQNLMGRFEESKYFAQRTFGETKTLKESYQGKFDELDKRIAALSKTLDDWGKKLEEEGKKAENLGNKVEDWGKKIEALEREAKAAKTGGEAEEEKPAVPSAPTPPLAKVEPSVAPPPSKKPEKPETKPVSAPEEAYKKAYDLFQKGEVGGAKGEFKRFLEVYPKSKYAENAHYWLGECYFAEKKFDEAILEFDEVIKKYPKGNKVPDALLRQGICFLELNDTMNAKLILKEVIKRFPKSDQAKRAQKKLKEIG